MVRFPNDFLWGAATASFQVEGHLKADGAGDTNWLTFCREPGRVVNDEVPMVGASQYTMYAEDVQLMKSLGIKAYRFSTSWARIQPDGRGPVNAKGLDYYDRLVDELLANGIEPWMTLFHWDLPQALEYIGGWRSKEVPKAFGEFAKIIAEHFSDRVKHFFTVNEIACFTKMAYGGLGNAPGLDLPRKAVHQTVHNGCLAHGYAAQALRACSRGPVKIGLADNGSSFVPALETPENIEAAKRAFRLGNADIATLIREGRYIPEYLEAIGDDAPEYDDAELSAIATPIDFHGLNLYTASEVLADDDAPHGFRVLPRPASAVRLQAAWLYLEPRVLYWVPRFVSELWPIREIYITENGCACQDRLALDGYVYDTDRVEFLRAYLAQAARAIEEGVPIKGYFLWSLIDNFEWERGFSERFGMVYVNYQTLGRIPKLSARFYHQLNSTGILP